MDRKVAIITGAARQWGMGRQIALDLARKGVDIAIADVRPDWGRSAADQIAAESGQRAAFFEVDITRQPQVVAMVDRVAAQMGRVDILINNAAIVLFEKAAALKAESLDRTFDVNFKGTAFCCQAVIPHMRKQGGGRIVNIASEAATAPMENLALYSASKAAVVMFSKVLALESVKDNITVTVVAPGPMRTLMGQERGPTKEDEALVENLYLPFGRQLEPAEVADIVVYAALYTGHAMTGQTLHVNGGRFMV
ncbi:MAG: SDR family NAD(P)-dependent oxidoreductase [Candidatus Binataceae bacterium]